MVNPTQTLQEKDKAAANAKELGITPGIVASGEMFKQGLLWGAIGTAISWGFLVFLRKKPSGEYQGNFVYKAGEFIHEKHGQLKDLFKSFLGFVTGKKVDAEHAVDPAVLSVSFIIGGLAGKLALPGAYTHGREKGRKAIALYGNLKKEIGNSKGTMLILSSNFAQASKQESAK